MELPGVAELVQRHNIRRITMSTYQPTNPHHRQYPPLITSYLSSPDPSSSPPMSPNILKAVREASEPPSSLPDIRPGAMMSQSCDASLSGSPIAYPSSLQSTPATGRGSRGGRMNTDYSTGGEESDGGEQIALVPHDGNNLNSPGSPGSRRHEQV